MKTDKNRGELLQTTIAFILLGFFLFALFLHIFFLASEQKTRFDSQQTACILKGGNLQLDRGKVYCFRADGQIRFVGSVIRDEK